MEKIINRLKFGRKMTAMEISKEISISPKDVIRELVRLESREKVSQLNGYWYAINPKIENLRTTLLLKVSDNKCDFNIECLGCIFCIDRVCYTQKSKLYK